MVVRDLQDFWTLVSSHRRGDEDSELGLELMSYEVGKPAELARRYLHEAQPLIGESFNVND